MGCFNTVYFNCPRCGSTHEMQTKSGDCSLSDYRLSKTPAADLLGLIDESVKCSCGLKLTIVVRAFAEIEVSQ